MAEQNFQHIIPSLQNCISERNIMQSKLLLEELYPADIAELLQEFTVTEQKFLLDCIDNDISSSVLLELDEDERGKLLESFSAKEIAEEMIQEMDSDDAADIISELSEGKKEEVIAHIDDEEHASSIVDLLKYDEDTAGGIMAKELIKVNESWSVLTSVKEMRKQAESQELEEVYSIYVIDDKEKLKDTVNRNRYSALEAILNNKVYDSNLSAAGNNLEKSLHREDEQKRSSFIYLLIGGFIFILLITALLVLNWKRRKEVAAFKKFRLDAKNLEDRPTVTVVANTHDVALEDAINADTEKEILNGLAQFENKTQFNEKGITLGKLSTQLNTNVKYLSHVVKKHKADNFNLYINQLRVNHVVKQLKDDECFIKYKISHLSEISGYSSPAAFTRAFSKIIGVIPSTYIKLLSEEKLKKA